MFILSVLSITNDWNVGVSNRVDSIDNIVNFPYNHMFGGLRHTLS